MLSLEAYFSERCWSIERAISRGTRPNVGRVAGSNYANRFLKLILIWPLGWLPLEWPRLKIVMFVDDAKIKLLGTMREAVATSPEVTMDIC